MSQSGVIVRRNANQLIPTAFMELALQNNPHGWGAAIVSEENGEKILQLNSDTEGLTMEEMQDTLKTFMKEDITFYLCNSDAALSGADLSPHILIATEGDDKSEIPQVITFIEGNFPGSVQADSSHPPEYHLVNDILVPKFEQLFELCDGNLDKIVEQMKKPHFKKEILLHSVSRGHITIVAANGASLTFSQPDGNSMEYPWGWVSNNYGYAAGAPKVVVAAKKPGMFQRGTKSTVREAAPPAAAIADVVKPKVTAGKVIQNYSVRKDSPATAMSRRDRKNWYQSRIGYKPNGWENCIAIDCYIDPQGKLMTYSQVKALGLKATEVIALANNPPAEKDFRPEHIQSKDTLPTTTEKEVAEILPIMSPATREHIKKMLGDDAVKKIIAENAEIINDPKNIEGYETKFADFAKQLGAKSMREFSGWTYEMMYELAKTKPDGLANMCLTFRNLCMKNGLFEVEEKVEEVKAEEKPKRPSLFKRSAAA